MDDDIRKKTQQTATTLFGKGIKMDPPYRMWKEFDRDLANDLSMFITGNLYSRGVLSLPERQMVACAMLAALGAADEPAAARECGAQCRMRPEKACRGLLSTRPLRGYAEGKRGAQRLSRRIERKGRVAH